jgi:glycine hydroxymethyltransferase
MSNTFFGAEFDELNATDPEIANILLDELKRLRTGIQLIASENYTSPAVLAALGSTLSNKYAEGYPGKRYYGGCEVVDVAETIGIERAKSLFDADHANLQPHSGASANIAVFGAFLQPGDTYLAMALPHGGHLTHGAGVSYSGKWFNAVHYGVAEGTEDIDYDQMRDLAREHKPKMIIAGGSAIPRLIDFKAIREIADEVGAIMHVDAAHIIGLIAGKAIPSPVPYADVVTFTTHKVLRGPRSGMILCKEEHAAKIDKAEARIDWMRPAVEVDRTIRGLSPFPGAWCLAGDERIKLLRSRVVSGAGMPGHVLGGLSIACVTGVVEVTLAQREGKRPMVPDEFLRGFALPAQLT